jgi:hypothetical protein
MATCFSQRDLRWHNDMLGTCGELTIGQAGCLITSMASILVDFQTPTDPHRLNAWLRSHWGYVNGCRFVWRAVAGLGAELQELIACEYVAAPMDRISRALAVGQAVVGMVDSEPGGPLEQHWLRILSVDGADCSVMDPWQLPGQELGSLIERYGQVGWNAARALLKVAIYARDGRHMIEFAPLENREEADLCIRGMD